MDGCDAGLGFLRSHREFGARGWRERGMESKREWGPLVSPENSCGRYYMLTYDVSESQRANEDRRRYVCIYVSIGGVRKF